MTVHAVKCNKILPRNRIIGIIAVIIAALFCLAFNGGTIRAYAAIGSGTCGSCSWVIDDEGAMTIRPTDGVSGTLASYYWPTDTPWHTYRAKVKKLIIEKGVKTNAGCYRLFCDLNQCIDFDVANLDTSNATRFDDLLRWNPKAAAYDVSTWNTSKVTNMGYMFEGCSSLTSLDLSSFNTARVTTMYIMFSGCSNLTYLDISNFDTRSSSTYMAGMFNGCSKLQTIKLGSKFRFNNSAILPTPSGKLYTGKWIREDKTYGPFTPAELRDRYSVNATAWAGTWVWEKKPNCTIEFKIKDGDSPTGSMERQTVVVTEDTKLNKNTYVWFNHTFVKWVDDKGNEYSDEDTIRAGTYDDGSTIILTAVWEKNDNKTNIKDGEFEFTLHGQEKAIFDGLPAGTAYQVWEETPDGWVLIQQEGTSGNIVPLMDKDAKFTNKYEPNLTSAQFSGTKTLDGKAAKAGAYSFMLMEPGNETQTIRIAGKEEPERLPITVSTLDGGFIQFPVIIYEEAGEHEYEIHEVNPRDPKIDYDTHTEKVKVKVTEKEDGTLSSSVIYDEDGIRFVNKTRPGTLKLTKKVKNLTEANKDDVFTFKITFYNENGTPLSNDESVYYATSSDYATASDYIIETARPGDDAGEGEDGEPETGHRSYLDRNRHPNVYAQMWEDTVEFFRDGFGVIAKGIKKLAEVGNIYL